MEVDAEVEQTVGAAATEAVERFLSEESTEDGPVEVFNKPAPRELGEALIRELGYVGYKIVRE